MTIPFRWHCQQICQQPSSERVRKGLAELEGISLASHDQTPDFINDLRLIDWLSKPAGKDLTTQAQRPGPRGSTFATEYLVRSGRHYGIQVVGSRVRLCRAASP
jgi:hypothetical protein